MSHTEIVKRFGRAFFEKDIDAINSIVAENYWFKGPMMDINSREELVDFIRSMPMEGEEIQADYIEQNDKVVKVYTCDFSVPPVGCQELCELFTITDGKIAGNQLFYDTAKWQNEH